MAKLKTQRTKASVDDFLQGSVDETRRRDCLTLVQIMKQATKAEAEMWGTGIVGVRQVPLQIRQWS